MKKRALLIGSPYYKNESGYLQGVEFDIKNMKNFLKSSTGGGWLDNEIIIFSNNPNYSIVKTELENLINYDFAFVYYSGHGYNQQKQDFINLNKYETVPISKIANCCKRQVTIVDACRNYSDSSPSIGGFGDIHFNSNNIDWAREAFNQQLSRCETGRILLNATSEGKSATDTRYGGYFTIKLLNETKRMAQTGENSILTIGTIFQNTRIILQNNQTPTLQLTNQNTIYFPFAVANSSISLMAANNNTNTLAELGEAILVGSVIGAFLVGIIGIFTGDSKKR